MKNSLKIRYNFIKYTINNLYRDLNITCYPIDPFKIINYFDNIKAISYSLFKEKTHINDEQLLNITKSKIGCCEHKRTTDKYMILYNDKCTSKGRILWTIIHELGHIMCNHYNIEFPPTLTDDEIYDFKEREANFFTSQFLAHPAILKNLDLKESYYLETYCGLSKEAALNRYNNFITYDSNHGYFYTDSIVLDNFKEYLEEKNEDYLIQQKFIESFIEAY